MDSIKLNKSKQGKWLFINQAKGYLDPPFGDTLKCSECGFVIDVSEGYFKVCPNCGISMKEEITNEVL